MAPTMNSWLKAAHIAFGVVVVFGAAPTQATTTFSDSPLFLTVAVPPNITVTLDDSGSMARAFVPDTCGASTNDCATLDNRYTKSAHFNPLYYNPNVKYPAAKNASGTSLTTSFTAAYRNGFDTTFGTALNLTNSYRPSAFLNLPPGGTASEGYMDHYSDDVRCDTSTPRMCQISNGAGGWVSGTLACVGNSNANRDTYCKTNSAADAFPAPAYYYVFDASNSGCTGTDAQKKIDNDCYDIRIVSSTSGPGTIDLNGNGVVNEAADRDERQNFANWYSFARTRNFATQTAASLAFSELDSNVRVAWQALNTCRGSASSLVDTDCDGWKENFTSVSNRINSFTGTHKSNFYSWIFQLPTNNSTPLPAAMQRVGEYYRTSGENSPYDNNFATTNSGELVCRRNYHVMMTDGIWNNAISVPGGNKDNTTIALPETENGVSSYSPLSPFRDNHSNTLADLAFHYWVTDLRSTLANDLLPTYRDTSGTNTQNVWNPRNDPATWQHMVNFTIGLGLTDYLSQEGLTWSGDMYSGSYSNLAAGTTQWPQPAADDPANVADLWHAAINSRGQFFSANDPDSLSTAFRAALTAITEASGSTAALSANSTSLTGSTVVYQARFNDDWSGTLLALPVASDGTVNQTPSWDAGERIPAHGSRRIFTHNGTSGVAFSSCSNLSTTQQLALNKNSLGTPDGRCSQRLDWIRGSSEHEQRSTVSGSLKIFRNRPDTVMGDIINSDPAYVKDVDYGYDLLPSGTPGQSSYTTYRANNASRVAMVYVGSNDGMMHGIRGDIGSADSGEEKFAYIPGGVYSNLSLLTDPSYVHRYYVDGGLVVRDAYINGAWKTVLLGGLNAGGKTIYALDVTNPTGFGASNVLWEFDPSDDADVGLTYSRPQVGILENGQWVAVFGNGYNSTSGGAHLYVVNLETGALLQKITAADNSAIDDNNGLSTPILVDRDGNHLIDTAYAGDLQGNLWKFNLSASSPAAWNVANNQPLFAAELGSTKQPITAQPKVAANPAGGHLILFGTGRYLASSDVSDTAKQSYYGIWDNGTFTSTAHRSDLQAQTFDFQDEAFSQTVRSVSNNTVDWAGGRRGWYLDLVDGIGSGSLVGERVVSTSVIIRDAVIFSSIIPGTNPCEPGGTSWLFVLKLDTGGQFPFSIFDLNDDGNFNEDDQPDDSEEFINVKRMDVLGITTTPLILEEDSNSTGARDVITVEQTGLTGDTADTQVCLDSSGCPLGTPGPAGVTRRSWIQIR